MSAVNTRPVPVSLLRWPRTRDLVTQYKGILMYLWAHPDQTACGCYLFPLDATAADLSMSSPSLADALAEFHRRKLIDSDQATGEIMLPDWFRWYQPRTPVACGAVESAIKRILSTDLRQKTENSYKSTPITWKGKVKGKTSSKEEVTGGLKPPPSQPAAGSSAPAERTPKPARSASGIRCWTDSDFNEAHVLEEKHGLDEVQKIVADLASEGIEALPSRVAKAILKTVQKDQIVPSSWWTSEEATLSAAHSLGIQSHPGESWDELRRRIRQALQKAA